MRLQKGKIPQILLHSAIMICVAVLGLLSIEMARASYVSVSRADNSAFVARFSPSLISDVNIDILDIKKPKDSAQMLFDVQNFSDDSLSEVTMKYRIVVKTTGNLPLSFTLLGSDGSTLEVWNCDGMSGQREYEYESPLELSQGTAQAHGYTLKAEWRDADNAARFSGMTDAVYLSVVWEQID